MIDETKPIKVHPILSFIACNSSFYAHINVFTLQTVSNTFNKMTLLQYTILIIFLLKDFAIKQLHYVTNRDKYWYYKK